MTIDTEYTFQQLSNVRYVRLASKYLQKLLLVIIYVAFHQVHAGAEQPLECVDVKN